MEKMRLYWPVFRIVSYIIIGLMNTVFLPFEAIGSWRNVLGYGLLILAIVEIVFQFVSFLQRLEE